jgi:RhtB (resistance to homoserine/threonine) family protein
MQEYLYLILILTLGLISPGPDFIVVLKNSISYSRKHGIYTSLGVALGSFVHVSYTLLGLGTLLHHHVWILEIFKYLGAAYLIYIGYKSFKNSGRSYQLDKDKQNISVTQALLNGFLTNALNPKAAIFFIGVFTLVVQKDSRIQDFIAYSTTVFIQTFTWFCFVSIFFTYESIRNYFDRIGPSIDKVIGLALAGFGIKLICSKS